MAGIELKYVHLQEDDDYLSRPKASEACLDVGDGATPAAQPAGPPPVEARSEVGHQRSSFVARISPLASDPSGSGSNSRGGIAPEHLDVKFESCFRETKPLSTIGVLYQALGTMFLYTRVFLYNVVVVMLGIIVTFIWAVLMGFFSFYVNYVWSPSLRLALLLVASMLPLVTEPLRILLSPLADVVARVFRQIRIRATLDGGLFDPVSDAQPLTGPQRYVYYIILAIVLVFLAGVNLFVFAVAYFMFSILRSFMQDAQGQ